MNFKITSFLVFCMAILLFNSSQGAPIPATTSSLVINPERKIFFSPLGFKIEGHNTLWEHSEIQDKNSTITTIYQEPYKPEKEQRAFLTVRTDALHKNKTLSQYIKTWIHEYPHYGFDIVKTKKIKLKETSGFLIDIFKKSENEERHRKIRQIVFLKEKVAVILSCVDHNKTFRKSLKTCNKIIRSFQWTR